MGDGGGAPGYRRTGRYLHVSGNDRSVTTVVCRWWNRDRSGAGNLLDRGLERRKGDLDVAGVHLDVACVDDAEVLEAVRSKGQAGALPVVRFDLTLCVAA